MDFGDLMLARSAAHCVISTLLGSMSPILACSGSDAKDTSPPRSVDLGCVSTIQETDCPHVERMYWACDNCGDVWACYRNDWSNTPTAYDCSCVLSDGRLDTGSINCREPEGR